MNVEKSHKGACVCQCFSLFIQAWEEIWSLTPILDTVIIEVSAVKELSLRRYIIHWEHRGPNICHEWIGRIYSDTEFYIGWTIASYLNMKVLMHGSKLAAACNLISFRLLACFMLWTAPAHVPIPLQGSHIILNNAVFICNDSLFLVLAVALSCLLQNKAHATVATRHVPCGLWNMNYQKWENICHVGLWGILYGWVYKVYKKLKIAESLIIWLHFWHATKELLQGQMCKIKKKQPSPEMWLIGFLKGAT